MLATVGCILLVLLCLCIWGVYKLVKYIVCSVKSEIGTHNFEKKQKAIAEQNRRTREEFDSVVARTEILSRQKVFDTSRKHHCETTFKIHLNNSTTDVVTVADGTEFYNWLMNKLDL